MAMAMAAAATGTLMKKMARHETESMSHPPTNGPTTTLTPLSPDHRPTARARSSGTKHAEMIARLPGTSSAPPIPCSARAAISTSVFGAAPQMTEAAVKEARPNTNTRRRPNRSPSEPPRMISAPRVSRYASVIHCRSLSPVCRSRAMVGRATLTTVESRKATPEPSTAVARTQRPAVLE